MISLTSISDAVASDLGRNITPTFGYYRQPNGWITISPNTRLERLKYTEEGWTYLEAYGAFDMTSYTVNHPFEGLFMFGGAKEMSAEQVIETGLYIKPPLIPVCHQHITQYHRSHTRACWRGATPVEFPQLEFVFKDDIGPFVCEFCKRDMPTKAAREQHQSVAHAKPLGNIQTGRSLGTAVADAIKDEHTNAALRARVAELEAAVAEKVVKKGEPAGKARDVA